MIEETLRAQAQVITDMLSTHDTDDFMHRLATRISQDANSSDLPAHEAAPATVLGPDADTVWPSGKVTEPSAIFTYPRYQLRRAFRRLRRRPVPSVPVNTAAPPAAVLNHLWWLCDAVVHADDARRLMAAFETHYDGAGARSFACLLYIVGRKEGALYWWRFAAGAGDPLAAHLLAAHHSAVGTRSEARVWHGFAGLLGFRDDRHIPQLIPSAAQAEYSLARAPSNIAVESMDRDRLLEVVLHR